MDKDEINALEAAMARSQYIADAFEDIPARFDSIAREEFGFTDTWLEKGEDGHYLNPITGHMFASFFGHHFKKSALYKR